MRNEKVIRGEKLETGKVVRLEEMPMGVSWGIVTHSRVLPILQRNNKMKCDHLIGVMDDDGGTIFIHMSERESITDSILREYTRWRKRGLKALVEEYDKFTREEHFNDAVTRFSYCPDCGAKNDL